MEQFSDNQRYSLEEAQAEAEELIRLVQEGYASNYEEAEDQLTSNNARRTLNRAMDGLFADLRPLHEVIEEQQKADEAAARAKKIGRYNIYRLASYEVVDKNENSKEIFEDINNKSEDNKKEWGQK